VKFKSFLPILISIVVLALALIWVPRTPVDPWGLVNLYNLFRMILLLAGLQVVGGILHHWVGDRGGVIIYGFLAGLISSTALTISISRQSHDQDEEEIRLQSLVYLSAILAMILESLGLVLLGIDNLDWRLLIIFVGPISLTIYFLARRARRLSHIKQVGNGLEMMGISAIIKLALFISVILAASKILQSALGEAGIFLLTFVVCLFELHGSIIANVQLFDAGEMSTMILASLLTVGLLAAYISKIGLVIFMANPLLRKKVINYTLQVAGSLICGWIAFYALAHY
jgi:uncharacterized membrane protein (DUF4010 family)